MRFSDIRAGLFPDGLSDEARRYLIETTTPRREPQEKLHQATNRFTRRALRSEFVRPPNLRRRRAKYPTTLPWKRKSRSPE